MDLSLFTRLPSVATIILTDAQMIPPLVSGGLFMTSLVFGSLLAGVTRCSKFIFIFPVPILELAISPKNSRCFQWRMDLETTVLALRVLIESRLLGWTQLGK